MLLGILSDSHGDVAAVRRALNIFDKLGVELLVHCGDVGGQDVFAEFVGRSFRFVWGNTDVPTHGLRAFLNSVALPLPESSPLMLLQGGMRIAVFHGHEPAFPTAHRHLKTNYIFHGHTHVARDENMGNVRVINPGALHRAPVKTVASLETESNKVQFHQI